MLAPRLGRVALQIGAVIFGLGIWWLRQLIAVHGMRTGSLTVAPAELVVGLGLGMVISPLFDFILASVREREVGSASGVLNAVQQLAAAVGVAVLGTVFFSALGDAGFVAAIERCLLIELFAAPVLVVFCGLLPRFAREQGETAPADQAPVTGRRPADRSRAGRGVGGGQPATSSPSISGPSPSS